MPDRPTPFVIAGPCIGVKEAACVEACQADCIHPRPDERGFSRALQLYIDPETCIECGECVPVCSVAAIFRSDELPAEWIEWVTKNARYYWKQAVQTGGME